MKSRHRAREIALQILYQFDVATHPDAKVLAKAKVKPNVQPLSDGWAHSLSKEFVGHFEHFDVPEGLREFSALLVAGSLQKMAELDAMIEETATHWKVSRMAVIDRNLLRIAVYELLHLPETPPSVVIDEAIELAKSFGTAESPAFVNGILDAVLAAKNK